MAPLCHQTLLALLLVAADGHGQSQQQASPPEQENLEKYAQEYLPPGDFAAYAEPWLGKKAQWRGYMTQYTDHRANYPKYMKEFGGSKADYNQYVKLYSSMAGAHPSSGQNWKGKQASQMGAWQKSMGATVNGYVPESYQQFASQAMASRGDDNGVGNLHYLKDANQTQDLSAHASQTEKSHAEPASGHSGNVQDYSKYAKEYASKYASSADQYQHDFQKYMDQFHSGNYRDYAQEYAPEWAKFMKKQRAADDDKSKVGDRSQDKADSASASELLATGASAPVPLELSSEATNTTQLKQEAQDAVDRMEALAEGLHRSAKDKEATHKAAAASAEAVVKDQSEKLQHFLGTLRNCSETPEAAQACAHKAAETERQLRHEGRHRLRQTEKHAEEAARAAARGNQEHARSLAREVRHRTDALARHSRDASEEADALDRKAEDLADKAERSAEDLARSQEDAAQKHCAEAKKRLDSEVRVPDNFLAAQPQAAEAIEMLAAAPAAGKAEEGHVTSKAGDGEASQSKEEEKPKAEEEAKEPSKKERKAQEHKEKVEALRSKANRMVADLEQLTEGFKQASKKEEVQHQAEADMGAVSELQQHTMQGVLADFHNCSADLRAKCEGDARDKLAHLRHETKEKLKARSHAAAAAARRAARRAERHVRDVAAEVRRTTDELARADGHSADFADRTSRHAEDLASEAERHIETLARRRSAAFEHEGSRADNTAEKYARQATRALQKEGTFLAADRPASSSVSPAMGLALAAGSMAAAWVGMSVFARRRRSAPVLMPEAVLG